MEIINKKNICLIDDDEIYQFLCKKTIEKSQHVKNIMVFFNGKDALDFFQENLNDSNKLPDVIFLDIDMPLMDGWQFLEEYLPMKCDIEKNIIIYIVTSSSHPSDLSKAKEISDVTGYLIKPITIDNFNTIMNVFQS